MSVGLATCNGESGASALLDRADTCLYEAKRRGRNRVVTEQGKCVY
jgi:PleD family two-component response regulator